MTEAVATKKTRRDADALKAFHAGKIKAIEEKQEIADKKLLLRLASDASTLAKRRTAQPTIGQAATLLSQAAATIKAEIPQ